MSWFPSDNAPSDKATYDLRMTVPKGISVWGNGILRSSTSRGVHTTYWWHQPQRISTYLVTATLGRFDRRTGRTARGLPVYLAVDPAVKGAAWATVQRTAEITDWLTTTFGRYPFSATGGVVDDAAIRGLRARDGHQAGVRPGTRPADGRARAGAPVVRRLGDAADLRRTSGSTRASPPMSSGCGPSGTGAGQRPLSSGGSSPCTPASDPFWTIPPANPGGAAQLFTVPVYQRGAMALEALRQRIGDRAFFRLLRTWAADHRYGVVSTADLLRTAERVSGRQLDRLFDAWLYQPRRPAGS